MDLIGYTFNHWTVLDGGGFTKDGKKLWKCKCSCTVIKLVRQYSLESGKSKSCGCRNGKDLTNQIFGNLKALEPSIRGDRIRVWRCKCVCGNEPLIRAQSLVEGHSKSCGCLKEQRKFKATVTFGDEKFSLSEEEFTELIKTVSKSKKLETFSQWVQLLK